MYRSSGELLVAEWSSALGTHGSAESDFIALGGNSFSAVTIAAAVAQRFRSCEDLQARALQCAFEAPTLQAMAEALAALVNGAE